MRKRNFVRGMLGTDPVAIELTRRSIAEEQAGFIDISATIEAEFHLAQCRYAAAGKAMQRDMEVMPFRHISSDEAGLYAALAELEAEISPLSPSEPAKKKAVVLRLAA